MHLNQVLNWRLSDNFRREGDELEHQISFETDGEEYDDSKDAQGIGVKSLFIIQTRSHIRCASDETRKMFTFMHLFTLARHSDTLEMYNFVFVAFSVPSLMISSQVHRKYVSLLADICTRIHAYGRNYLNSYDLCPTARQNLWEWCDDMEREQCIVCRLVSYWRVFLMFLLVRLGTWG